MTMLPPRVQELALEVAAGHGVGILEVHLRREGRSRVLGIVLDPDGPLEADVVEDISKELSAAFDMEEPLPGGAYTLEVTTPGLDRPLHTARDFRRQLGHEVRIATLPAEGERTAGQVQGVVLAVDDDAVTLDVDGAKVDLPLARVVRGKVVLPW